MNIIKSVFWVVTKPTELSQLVDICFQSTWQEMQQQFLGGLKSEQIHGIYTDEAEALQVAGELLAELRG